MSLYRNHTNRMSHFGPCLILAGVTGRGTAALSSSQPADLSLSPFVPYRPVLSHFLSVT